MTKVIRFRKTFYYLTIILWFKFFLETIDIEASLFSKLLGQLLLLGVSYFIIDILYNLLQLEIVEVKK